MKLKQLCRRRGKRPTRPCCACLCGPPCPVAARDCVPGANSARISTAHDRFSHGGPEVYYATIQQILEEEDEDDLWFFDAKRADVGALFDMGVYAIAHLVTLLGTAKSVVGRCTTVGQTTTARGISCDDPGIRGRHGWGVAEDPGATEPGLWL